MQNHLYTPSPSLVLIAAHRSLWRDTPENSETGIRLAFATWEMIETDLRKTIDATTVDELVITHDGEISRTTNGMGLLTNLTLAQVQSCNLLDRYGAVYKGGTWYPGDKDGTPMNDADTGAGQKVLTFSQLLRIQQDFLTSTNCTPGKQCTPAGPIIVMDTKGAVKGDPDRDIPGRGVYTIMKIAIEKIKSASIGQRQSLVFMVKFNILSDPAATIPSADYFEQNVPDYKTYDALSNPLPRIMLVFNPEDGPLAEQTSNFESWLKKPYLSHFEMNQYYIGDGCQPFIDRLTTGGFGISTYSENAYFPEGVWDSGFKLRNQDLAVHPVDYRDLPDYTIANKGVALVTTERPDETDAFLRGYNLRNVPTL